MDTNEANNPEPVADAPAPRELAPLDPTSQEPEIPDGVEPEGQAPEDEFDEVDFEGKRYRVPKDVAPALMRQADYTRKTQEVAALRQSIEAQRGDVQREAQINHELIDDVSNLRAVEARLQSFQKLDWNRVDPADAQRLMLEQMQLRDARNDITGRIQYRRSEIAARQQQESAKLISQAVEHLSRPDPKFGWDGKFDAEKRTNLTQFGLDLGFSNEEMATTNHPLMIKTLRLAQIGAQALKARQVGSRPSIPEANPVPQVGASRAKGAVDPEKMSGDDWMKWRNSQLAKRNR